MRAVSIHDVAERAGVSPATVSNTLNRPEKVSRKVQTRVRKAIADLGYVRNESASTLRSGRSREISLLITEHGSQFFGDIARGADAAADEIGDVVTVCSSNQSAAREINQLNRLASQHVKGILVTPLDWSDLDLSELIGSHVPVIVVARIDGQSRCSVSCDDVAGGELAATHLLNQGHRNLAFFGGFTDRRRGVQQATTANGDPAIHLEFHDCQTSEEGGRQLGDHLAKLPANARPTGVICGNDQIATGVLQAMTVAGLRVPEDVAIIGYDDIASAAGAAVPLSTIRQPREELGRSAVRLLLDEIAEGATHHHRAIIYPPELVTRTSTHYRRTLRSG